MLYYFPQIWISDQTDVPVRARIQCGASLCYPLSSMSCHVTASPEGEASRFVSMQSRAHIAHLGATGYEFDTTKLADEDLTQIRRQVAAYHQDEKLMLEGNLYRLCAPNEDSSFFAVEQVSKDKKTAKLTAMRFVDQHNELAVRLYPRGLEEDILYGVPELEWAMPGRNWMQFGIESVFAAGDYQTAVYHFVAK